MNECVFVAAAEQCPPKPRGRKKKASKTTDETPANTDMARPSAAAAGFDTKGMTDVEVQNHINDARKNKDIEDEHDTNRKSAKKGKRKEANITETSAAPKRKAKQEKADQASIAETSTAPKAKSRKTEASIAEASTAPKAKSRKTEASIAEASTAPKAKSRKTEASIAEAPASKKGRSKKAEAEEASIAEASAAKKGKSKKAEVAETSAAPKRKSRKAKGEEASVAAASAAPKRKSKKRELTAEEKAKLSRKSSAYHVARRLAKLAGKSEEEQCAAGAAAPCLTYAMWYAMHLCDHCLRETSWNHAVRVILYF